ncbi:MAG: YihA family ribosome biogenesis GTP-binding protein [Clostridiales bacterium]|nr:YihA family ribosome biogenesis GTP-binding protein [Candidatus Equinaster intestinalis]
MNYNNVNFEAAFGKSSQFIPSDLPEICFSGRSNVGKSSIINAVLSRKSLARVSTKPGKTVTVNFYRVDNIRLADLPGYGYAKVDFAVKERFSELMEGYFGSGRNIKMVFQLIDMRHKPSADDIDMLKFLNHYKMNYCIILTKSDKLNKTEYAENLEMIKTELGFLGAERRIIPTSALKSEGIPEIRKIIEEISEN